ncbi:MAG TPA: DNA recombination protein RmuC, partial [Methylibium sp.]
MTEWIALALATLNLLLLLWLALRKDDGAAARTDGDELKAEFRNGNAGLERGLRDELTRGLGSTRQELGSTLANFQQTLLTQQGDVARTQNEQIEGFRTQLAATQQLLADTLRASTASLTQQSQAAREAQDAALKRFADTLGEQLRSLSEANERRLSEVRTTVEQRLIALQADNEKKLEQMRQTVDEKLHATLEQRLGESFKQVAERLEQVHRGLGEMQTLAQG